MVLIPISFRFVTLITDYSYILFSLFRRFTTLNPLVNLTGFILPPASDLMGGHILFVYPSKKGITCYAEVCAHFFSGVPTFRDLIHFLHVYGSPDRYNNSYTIIHFNYITKSDKNQVLLQNSAEKCIVINK